MSGASVSSTSAAAASSVASRRSLQRALEGHGAAKAELETQRDERLRLLLAAVEGMRDARQAHRRSLPQVLEQPVGRAPHVQDHRQAVPARQQQLLAVEMFLALRRRARARSSPARSRRPPPAAGRRCAAQASSSAPGRRRARRCTAGGCPARSCRRGRAPSSRTASKLSAPTAGITQCRTPAAAARARIASRVGAEFGRVQVAMGINPERPCAADDARSACSGRRKRATVCIVSSRASAVFRGERMRRPALYSCSRTAAAPATPRRPTPIADAAPQASPVPRTAAPPRLPRPSRRMLLGGRSCCWPRLLACTLALCAAADAPAQADPGRHQRGGAQDAGNAASAVASTRAPTRTSGRRWCAWSATSRRAG